MQEKVQKNLHMCNFCSTFDILPHKMGTPSKVRSRPAEHMQRRVFFAKPEGFSIK